MSFIFVAAISFTSGLSLGKATYPRFISNTPTPAPTPLAQYSIDNLSQAKFDTGQIKLGEAEKNASDIFTTHTFSFKFNPTPTEKDTKTTTGQINLPIKEGKYPIIIMLRGFVPDDTYFTGLGTRNAAKFFAENGYITIAPDFLGYAGSDSEAGNIFETRFQTYTTVLNLINTIKNGGLPADLSAEALAKEEASRVGWDNQNQFIWAHSNGGQVALTVLAITKAEIPTALWAPVTKPFPYSVLYYTDEAEDGGKFLRSELAKFESIYDASKFSFTNYLENIKAPLQFHQGTGDDAIPIEWTEDLVTLLKKQGLEVEYQKHAGADHNMAGSWDEAMKQDLDFFINHTALLN